MGVTPWRRGAWAVVTATLAIGLVAVGPAASASTIAVNCATQHLQPKLDAAPGGSTVLVKGTCIGPFTIDANLTVKGNPTATLDGNDSGSALTINGTHTIHLIGLTITGGESTKGAGIDREGGGILTLNKVKVLDNLATGLTTAQGGGIFSSAGSLALTASSVVGNRALASDPAATEADGGGIYAEGPVTLVNSTISSNRATAYSFGDLSQPTGGGVAVQDAALTVTNSHIDGNRVLGIGPHGVVASGGGVSMSAANDDLSITGSTVSGNIVTANEVVGTQSAVATGGGVLASMDTAAVSGSKFAGDRIVGTSAGGDVFAFGGGLKVTATKLTMTSTRVTGSRAMADAGGEAEAEGGGLDVAGATEITSSVFSGARVLAHGHTKSAGASGGGIQGTGQLTLNRSTVDRNHVTGTSDDSTAFGNGGGISWPTGATITASTISRNTLTADAATGIAQTLGAGINLLGQFQAGSITNSTITKNLATSSLSAGSGVSRSFGGGIDSRQMTLAVTASTIAHNSVFAAGGSSLEVEGGGIRVESGTTTFEGTILALDQGETSPDCAGTVASNGNNLVQVTTGCTFGSQPSDRTGLNPKLAALENNGGPTRTLALLAGSPAINWIAPGLCPVPKDQRGVSRPQGPKCDIGSFERIP